MSKFKKETNETENYSPIFTCNICDNVVNIVEVEKHGCFKDLDFSRDELQVDSENRLFVKKSTHNETKETKETSSGLKQSKQKVRKIIHDNNIDIALIKEVKARSQLYNRTTTITQAKSNALWKDISDALRGKYSAADAKTKWRYLKNTYFRRKRENGVCWQSQYLSFLDPYEDDYKAELKKSENSEEAQPLPTKSSNASFSKQQEESTSTINKNKVKLTDGKQKSKNKAKNQVENDSQSEMEKFVATFLQQTPELDSTDGFCLIFADLLRQLPEHKRSTVQLKIWQKLETLVRENKESHGVQED